MHTAKESGVPPYIYIYIHMYVFTTSRPSGQTALHIAIVKGRLDFVRMLVQAGADVNAVVTGSFFSQCAVEDSGIYLGGTPLSFAVCMNQRSIVEYLLTHGARIDLQVRAKRQRRVSDEKRLGVRASIGEPDKFFCVPTSPISFYLCLSLSVRLFSFLLLLPFKYQIKVLSLSHTHIYVYILFPSSGHLWQYSSTHERLV